ncbi:MAG: ABC transporter permease [Woeseiaceae bacterium]|nr:ABC transporter permease [Woeseiaceae bacterium]
MNSTDVTATDNVNITVIEPVSGWRLFDRKELSDYRDLFFFLIFRDIKVLYAQTVLGFSWALLNPMIQILVFTIIFGRVAAIDTDGIPYALFSTVAIVPWTYMSNAMSAGSASLVTGQGMLGKIYFPRIIFPITPILAKLVDFAISILLIVIAMLYYGVYPTTNLLLLPLFVLMMVAVPFGASLWLSALAIRFRDVKFAMPFVIRMLIYSAPIVYTATAIPEKWRLIYSLNPVVGVIEGYRACLLGTEIPWMFIYPGIVTCVLLVVGGLLYFHRMEKVFVDVI